MDEDWNLRLQLGAHLDRAFENFQVRASIAIDFHLVLRAAHGEQCARRLHDARLIAGDLVEHRVKLSAFQREDDSGRAAGEVHVRRGEDLEFRAVVIGGDESIRKPAGLYFVSALRVMPRRHLNVVECNVALHLIEAVIDL